LPFQGEGRDLDLSVYAIEPADLEQQVCGAMLLERDHQW
jgi:hypothetical protein